DASRAFYARRLERLAEAAEVWAVAVGIVLVRANEAIEAGRRETAVARERHAIAVVSILVIAERLAPILVAVEDPQTIATAERCGEVAAVWREREQKSDIREIAGNSPNELAGLAVEYVNCSTVVELFRISPGCDRRSIRADRYGVHGAHVLGSDRNPDR